MGLFTSGLGAHLTWTLPFGLLIMFAIFNRFDARAGGGGTRSWCDALADLPACGPADHPALRHRHRLFGFTLSWDELARSSQAIGA